MKPGQCIDVNVLDLVRVALRTIYADLKRHNGYATLSDVMDYIKSDAGLRPPFANTDARRLFGHLRLALTADSSIIQVAFHRPEIERETLVLEWSVSE